MPFEKVVRADENGIAAPGLKGLVRPRKNPTMKHGRAE
jgi:hypothetical protein